MREGLRTGGERDAGVVALSPNQIVRLCTELENVSWVKEEVHPSTHSISALLAEFEERLEEFDEDEDE